MPKDTLPKPPQPPRLPAQPTAMDLVADPLRSEETYTDLIVTGGDLAGQTVDGVSLIGSHFTRLGLTGTEFQQLRCRDVLFSACDFANARWAGARFHRVALRDCRLLGFQAAEGQWQETLLQGCNGKLANFSFSSLKGVHFRGCDLSDSSFQSADLSGAVFHECDLSNAELSGVKLLGADLRGCRLDGLKIGVADLRGAIVDPIQAVGLIRLLGVVVTDTAP
ncbi:MAG: pentapeptide repeat-containing protein [Chloroflexota bacterium]|nr:pentapeptide repeat-containing protein [Chloroflexota bacterium]